MWQRQLLAELRVEGGESDGFTHSQSRACQGINIRPISGVPVSSEQVIRGLQVWLSVFPICDAWLYYLITFPLSSFLSSSSQPSPPSPSHSPTPLPYLQTLSHIQPIKLYLRPILSFKNESETQRLFSNIIEFACRKYH